MNCATMNRKVCPRHYELRDYEQESVCATTRKVCPRRYELRDYEQESVSEARELRDYERINEKVYGSNWVNVFDEFMG